MISIHLKSSKILEENKCMYLLATNPTDHLALWWYESIRRAILFVKRKPVSAPSDTESTTPQS